MEDDEYLAEFPEQYLAELPEQMRVRLAKRGRLLAEGTDPYPVDFPRTNTIAEVRARHPDLAADTATGEHVGVAGRVMLSRIAGKLCFATIRDGTGDIQVMLSADRLGEDALVAWKRDVDLGDHIGVEGEVISSRRGELSVLADRFAITAKALRPLPDKHHGLTDPESRVRQRYVDLIVNPKARRMAELRAAVTRAVREELHDRGFIEAETPILQRVHGGANARPFATHINAYDMDLYLRIALELYLKRLVVGGIEKVYEIGRNFRNEGVDATHNPEFTMLEAYEAYGDYMTVATLTRELIQRAAKDALGGTQLHRADGTEADIGGDWPVKSVHGAVSEALGEEVTPDTGEQELRALCCARGRACRAEVEPGPGPAGDVRAAGRAAHRDADLLPGLPGRGVPAHPGPPRGSRGWRSAGTWWRSAPSWAPATPSWSTRWRSGPGSPRSHCSPPGVTPRRWWSTRSSCRRWSTACPRPGEWAWASTGC